LGRHSAPLPPIPDLGYAVLARAPRWHKRAARRRARADHGPGGPDSFPAATGDHRREHGGLAFPNSRSQRIVFTGGRGEIGVDNAGLTRWGLSLREGEPCEGFLRVKSARPTALDVSLRSADGNTITARHTLKTEGKGEFENLSFALTPTADDANGRFAVTLSQTGDITLGY